MESIDLYIMLFVIFIIFSFVHIFCLKGEKKEEKEKEEKEKFVKQIFESCGIENNKNMKNSLMNLKSIISSANEGKSSKIPECFYSELLHYLFVVITNKVIECAKLKLLYYEKIRLRELFPEKSDIAERMIIVSKNKKIWNILNSCYLPKLIFALISYSNYKRGLVKEELVPYLDKIGKSIFNNEFNWHKEKGNSEIVKNLLENKVTCNNFDEQFLKYFYEIIIGEYMRFIYLECKRLNIDIDTKNFNFRNNDTIGKVMVRNSKNEEFWDLICKYNYPAVIAFKIFIELVTLQTSVKFNETENKEISSLISIFRVNQPLKYYNNIKIWKILNESPVESFYHRT